MHFLNKNAFKIKNWVKLFKNFSKKNPCQFISTSSLFKTHHRQSKYFTSIVTVLIIGFDHKSKILWSLRHVFKEFAAFLQWEKQRSSDFQECNPSILLLMVLTPVTDHPYSNFFNLKVPQQPLFLWKRSTNYLTKNITHDWRARWWWWENRWYVRWTENRGCKSF